MNPASLRSTLPDVDLDGCTPCRAHGFVRCFDVAFPNDGSQSDKRYFDTSGRAPAHVLMCNLQKHSAYSVNGICIPVDDESLNLLINRERRYHLRDISSTITAQIATDSPPTGPVFAFLGQPKYIHHPPLPDSWASEDYLNSIITGARFWEQAAPEFYHLAMSTTLFPAAELINKLHRVNL